MGCEAGRSDPQTPTPSIGFSIAQIPIPGHSIGLRLNQLDPKCPVKPEGTLRLVSAATRTPNPQTGKNRQNHL
jgi:hypothetical protein